MKSVRLISIFSTAIIVFAILFTHQNCGQKPNVYSHHLPPVGTTISITAVDSAKPQKSALDYDNLLIIFNLGGRSVDVDENVVLQFFEDGNEEPLYEISPDELLDMHVATDCSPDLISTLQSSLQGNALFCNKSLDLSRVKFFRAVINEKKVKSASAYNLLSTDDSLGLAVISIAFY